MKRAPVVLAVVLSCIGGLATGCTGATPSGPTSPPPAAVTGPSPGCGSTSSGPVTEEGREMWIGGAPRRYTITIPPGHVPGTDTPIPLVFDFHGLIEGMVGTHPFATRFSEKARAEGFAVVFPTGSNGGFNWDVALADDNPDLVFIDALLASLEQSLCIDRSSVYVTGLSNGAMMTSLLMCMRPNTFAAAAPVAGITDRCGATDRKVPFVTFHGTEDPILPYPFFSGVPQAIATKYGCVDPPVVTTLQPGPDPATGGAITHTTWDCAAADTAAEFYIIDRGGHSWPGSEFFGWVAPIVGPTATSIDATDIMWDFFSDHHL